MASSLLLLLDDIATILDDVSVMTKVAAKKTAGVLGDDLALNAEQVSGVRADRELPVVWAVAKGSVRNKLILVPAALAISAFLPWAVTPLLMAGGLFLCYEGFEKVAHKLLHRTQHDDAHRAAHRAALAESREALLTVEKDKIKGAIRTDFILSAEIIVIALGTVAGRALEVQVGVLVGIAALMTVGVYGLVAGIVKLDDLGLHLSRKASTALASDRPRHPARGAVADEVPVVRRHGSHVPGRRRHPHPRRARGRRMDPRCGRRCRCDSRRRRGPRRADADAGERRRRHRCGRARRARGEAVPAPTTGLTPNGRSRRIGRP